MRSEAAGMAAIAKECRLLKDQKKIVWAWSFYDWANPDNSQQSTFYLGLANSIASIIVAALAPFLGAIADKASSKKKFLFVFAFLGVIMTGALWFVQIGLWQLAVVFY